MAEEVAPTPTKEASSRLEAGLGHQVPDDHVGGGAGRGDADLGALEVGDGLDLVGAVLLHRERNAGIAAELDDGQDVLALGLHPQRVLVSPGDDVSRPAHQRRQRLRAALEVADLDIEALLLEVPELLRQRQRQIVERRRPADAELDVLLLRRLRARGAGGQCDGSGGGNPVLQSFIGSLPSLAHVRITGDDNRSRTASRYARRRAHGAAPSRRRLKAELRVPAAQEEQAKMTQPHPHPRPSQAFWRHHQADRPVRY